MKNSPFSNWVMHLWQEHLSELEAEGKFPAYKFKEYFNEYKWWLRREFKYQTKQKQ